MTFDLLANALSSFNSVRLIRFAIALVLLASLPFANWPSLLERQTNMDVVAKKLETIASPTDLIVVAPWQFGIPFNWYYHGTTPWVTVPQLSDHRMHRYDLVKSKMTSDHPIADLRQELRETLRSGSRVWFVGGIRIPRNNAPPLSLSSAPDAVYGWDNVAYVESWVEQLGVFTRAHALAAQPVALSAGGPVNELEDVPLTVAMGWHE